MPTRGRKILESRFKRLGLTQKESEEAVETLILGICDGLKQDGKVLISGFGRLAVRLHKSRQAKLPGKERTRIPARRTVRFKASPNIFNKLIKKAG